MKRAEKEYRKRLAAQLAREAAERQTIAAERLAIRALLDHRIPDSERLVNDMKHPLFLSELHSHGSGPTGVTYMTDVVECYARIIARRTSGDAQAVTQHFQKLIGEEQAGKLGINLGKLKMSDRTAPDGGPIIDIKLSDHDVVAIAEYLVSPDHLNLGNLPPNPFGNPRVANLLVRIGRTGSMAQITPSNPYSGRGGPTSHQLRYEMGQDVGVLANEISRAMPSNAAREAALKAMRLDSSLDIYTPRVVRRTGWQDIQVSETDPVTGQPIPVTRKIPVYGAVPGAPGDPTRYRVSNPGAAAGQLLDWFDTYVPGKAPT
jgi:hypothetical protein